MFNIFSTNRRFRKNLKKLTGFNPGNIQYYHQAFTHKSVAANRGDIDASNERLEFLGDAVLSLIMADYLYIKFPGEDEGFLSKLRAKAVNREFVNALGYKLGIDKFMINEAPLNYDIDLPPALVGNGLEALFGAIFKDKGYKTAKIFFEKMVLKYHLDMEQLSKEDLDYKSRLLEWGQKTGKKVEFVLSGTEREGNSLIFSVDVQIEGETYGSAQMPKKKKAEQEAAKLALEAVGASNEVE